eukprot:311419_1
MKTILWCCSNCGLSNSTSNIQCIACFTSKDPEDKQIKSKATNSITSKHSKTSNIFFREPKHTGINNKCKSKKKPPIRSKRYKLEHKLRNEWIIGSKCIVFSFIFKQW